VRPEQAVGRGSHVPVGADWALEPTAVSALAANSLRSVLGAVRPDPDGGRAEEGLKAPDRIAAEASFCPDRENCSISLNTLLFPELLGPTKIVIGVVETGSGIIPGPRQNLS
jgi:hypothetical protein